jgi:hypothetical protein
MGCESGRQDSNLRPLVPQTSPYFPPRSEFDLECFRREMVGMTTRARVMESAGIASTSTEVYWAYPSPLFPILFSYLELGRIATRPTRPHGMTVAARSISIRPSPAPGADHGARTRNFNLGKVTVRFCIQPRPQNPSGCLSTPIFEGDRVAFACHHLAIKWSRRQPP